MKIFLPVLLLGAALALGSTARAETLRLYIDADFSIERAAAEAIELGIRTALAEVDGRVGGHEIEIVARDHRGNVKRSLHTLQRFVDDERALAVFGGLHSPPYLAHHRFINEQGVLLLLPWAAAGPLTRTGEAANNWIFRLSIDDTKAGPFLVDQARKAGCRNISPLLIDTAWGRANRKTIEAALVGARIELARMIMFPMQLHGLAVHEITSELARAGTECVLLVSHGDSGAALINSLAKLPDPPRVLSHWGILGGPFAVLTEHAAREATGLRVLQTCGFQAETAGSPVLRQALEAAGKAHLDEISAPAGFVHGYDLTRLLIAAADQASGSVGWSGAINDKRAALKTALETLATPVPGILDEYVRPFAPFTRHDPDAHEALDASRLCLARFTAGGRLSDASGAL